MRKGGGGENRMPDSKHLEGSMQLRGVGGVNGVP